MNEEQANIASITKNLPNTVISFYPSFELHSDYNTTTKSYPNCVLEECGKPIVFITKQNKLFSINTVGTSYPSYLLYPSQKSLLIQDNYGAHVITQEGYYVSKNDPEFYHDRGGGITDNGEALALSHLGIVNIDGKSGFGSQVVGFSSNGEIRQHRQIIDGTVVQCNDNVFLISYGDEDITNPKKHSYQYDWNSNQFKDLNLPFNDQNLAIHSTRCIDSNSFEYIRTSFDQHIHGIWNKNSGFSDTKPVEIADIKRPNSIHNYSFSDNGYYYINDAGDVYFANFSDGSNHQLFNIRDYATNFDLSRNWSVAMIDNHALIIGKSIHNHNRHSGVLINMTERTAIYNKYIDRLDDIYKEIDIGDVRVKDLDSLKTWLQTLPDNKP